MIIDSHHHFWRYSTDEYGWISAEMSEIARDFGVDDLRATAEPEGVAGSVVVQARQSVAETDWLLRDAENVEFVRGVVGWAPLGHPSANDALDRWSDQGKLIGFRHVVQDEPDDDFLDGLDFNRGVAEALRRGYAYDLLVFARQLPAAIRFADRHCDGRLVLDHIAKPAIAAGEMEPWRTQLTDLARRPNVCCKVSGVVTEADWCTWDEDAVRPYLDVVLEAFGPHRLMFGSDWPVCLLATGYSRWLGVVREWASRLSDAEQDAIFWGTVTDAYQLDDHTA